MLKRIPERNISDKAHARYYWLGFRRSHVVAGLLGVALLGAAFWALWGTPAFAYTGVGSGSSGSGGSGGGYTWHVVGNGKKTDGSPTSSAWNTFYNNSPPCGINCHSMFTSSGYKGISWHDIEPGCKGSAYIWYRTDNGSGGYQLVAGSGYSESPSNVVSKIKALGSPGSTAGYPSYVSVRDDQLVPYVSPLPSSMSYIYIICSSNLPQPDWHLKGSTSASKSSVQAGSSVKFSSTVTNYSGSGKAAFNYGPRHFYSNTDQSGTKTIPSGETTSPTYAGALQAGASYSGANGAETVSIPANTSYKYICGTIAFSPYNSSGDKDGRSPAKCIPISKDAMPTGTLSLSCSGVAGIITATFKDTDVSGSKTTAYATLGSWTSSQVTGTSVTASSPWRPTASLTQSGTWSVALYAKDVGSSGDGKFHKVATASHASCAAPSISGNCPHDATINGNELVKVGLPDETPSPQAAPPTYTRSRGATYTQYVPTSKTTVSSVQDVPAGGEKAVSSSAIPTHQNDGYQTTTLNYAGYVTHYPYDQNQASVTYKTYYVIKTYKAATTPSYYDCDYGGSASGSTCTYDPCGGATRSHSGLCYYAVGGYTQKTCPYTWYSTIGCAYHTSAYCGYGSLSYTSSYNSCSYTGAPEYKYSLSSTSGEQSISNTVNAYQMQACYYRNFQITGVSPAANFEPIGELENPTGVSATSTGTVKFSVKHGGSLRTPYMLNGLGYDIDYSQACTDYKSGSLSASGGYGTASETDAWTVSGDPDCTNMTPSPPIVGTKGCVEYAFGQSGGEIDSGGTIRSASGDTGTVSGSGCTPKIENEPYLKVFGGDVLAGAGFTSGATCIAPGNGQILGWNRGDGSYTHGSGTEFAAYAISHIKGFSSAQGGGVTAAGPPSGLAFANSPIGGGDYGGNLAGAGCIPDYYSQRSGNTLPTTNLGSAALTAHTYTAAGVNGLFGTVPAGRQLAIYVAGDVYISSNINYAIAGSVTDLPSLTVIATGNIYISGNVTHLDGNYIAQNSKIYDCAASNGTPYSQGDIYANCKNKLTVNGSFVSKQTLFLRTGDNGSLRFSDGDAGPGSNNASEEFDYSPVLWMAPPANNSQPPAYDAVTSLPPIL